MKRLMLLPALALALAACSEAPTAPLPTPGGPQWDLLSHPDSDLAFIDEGATTNCRRVTPTEVACTFEITGAAFPNEIKVSTYVEFVWMYECLAKNPRNNTHGFVTQTSVQWGTYAMDPVWYHHTHTATQPTENPCPRSGNPTVRWSPHVQYWSVHAEYRYLRGWICKSSDGTCR